MEIIEEEKKKIIKILDFDKWNLKDIKEIMKIKNLNYLNFMKGLNYKDSENHYLFILDENKEIYDMFWILDNPHLLEGGLDFYLYKGIL